jgi:hypothetical protein
MKSGEGSESLNGTAEAESKNGGARPGSWIPTRLGGADEGGGAVGGAGVPEGLNDRAADIWEPLLVLADLAGGDWPERARKAAVGLSASAQDHDPMGSLLMDILELFLRLGRERVFSRTLAEWLNRAEDRPWMALKKGKVVTGQWVAQQLQDFGIRPKTLRIGEERAKGYEMDDFADVFRRYIPRREWETFKAEVQEEAARRRDEEKAKRAAGNGSPGDGAKEAQGKRGPVKRRTGERARPDAGGV